MSVRSGQSITTEFTTRAFATGTATDATGTPTGTLYVNGTSNAATVTVTSQATGIYKAQVTLPTLAVSDVVSIIINATVSGITDNGKIWEDSKDVFAGAIPDVVGGGVGGLFIAGSNAATTTSGFTFGAISATTITASGAVAFQSTFAVATSSSMGALSCTTLTASGAVAFQSTFAVTTSTSLAALSGTTVTFSGAVAFQSTFIVTGTTTFNALTVTNNFLVSGTTTFTGVFTASAGFVNTYPVGSYYPENVVDSGTAQSATGTTLVLRSAAAFADSELIGATVVIRSATAGAGQRRLITANVGSTDTVTVDTWTTTPTGTIIYDIFGTAPASTSLPSAVNVTQWLGTTVSTPTVAGVPNVNAKTWNDLATVSLPLIPTTAGRTLDVSSTGEAGVDWANVGSPTTTLALTGTTIAVTQKVDVDTIKTNPVVNAGTITFPTTATLASTTNITAGTIATLTNLPAITANWLTATGIAADAITDAKVASDVTIASVTGAVGSVTGAVGSVTGAVGSVTGAVGSVTGAVGSVTGNVGGNVTGSVGLLATQAKTDVANAVWDATLASHLNSGSTGFALNAAGSAGDPWGTTLPGAYGAGTAGHIIGTSLPDIAPGSANGLLRGGTNTATTFATLTSTGVFSVNGVSDVSQTGDNFARIGANGSGLTAVALTGTQAFNNTGTWTGNVVGTLSTLTTYTGNTPQTGDSFARIGVNGGGLTAVGLTGTQTFNNTGSWTGNITGSLSGTAGGIAGTTQTLDALQTALNSSHGAGSWATATGFSTFNAAVTPVLMSMTQAIASSQTDGTVGAAMLGLEAQAVGKWTIVGTTLTLFRKDGTTVVRVFSLDSATNPTSRT